MSLNSEDEMRAAFRVFDLDGDGLIDSEELRLTMAQLGETLTDADIDAMIRAVDRNKDGKVDYEGQYRRTLCLSVCHSVCLRYLLTMQALFTYSIL